MTAPYPYRLKHTEEKLSREFIELKIIESKDGYWVNNGLVYWSFQGSIYCQPEKKFMERWIKLKDHVDKSKCYKTLSPEEKKDRLFWHLSNTAKHWRGEEDEVTKGKIELAYQSNNVTVWKISDYPQEEDYKSPNPRGFIRDIEDENLEKETDSPALQRIIGWAKEVRDKFRVRKENQ